MKKLTSTFLAAVLGLAALGATHARAQALLTFSGGLGTPLTLTLNAPVTYAITTAGSASSSPYFIFQGVGNVYNTDFPIVSSTLTFTINGGPAQTVDSAGSGFPVRSIAATDVLVYGSQPGLAVGDTVVLGVGTLTTTGNYAGAPPAGGSFQTFIADGAGNKLDAVNGVSAAPEPSTWALLGAGILGLGGLTLRQHRRAAAVRA